MATELDDVRFSGESIDLLRSIKYAADRRVSDRASEHALQAGRDLVTEADVLAVLRSALAEVAAEQVRSEHAEPSAAAELATQ